jgi:hypothetical protein
VAVFAPLPNFNRLTTVIVGDFPVLRGDSILRFFFVQSGQMVSLGKLRANFPELPSWTFPLFYRMNIARHQQGDWSPVTVGFDHPPRPCRLSSCDVRLESSSDKSRSDYSVQKRFDNIDLIAAIPQFLSRSIERLMR